MKPVRTDYKTPDQEEANLIENEANVQLSRPAINQESSDVTDSPRSAYHSLEILKREPNLKTIFEVLKYLSHSVSFCLPSPLTSQLINVLVTEMVPHIWPILSELESNGKKHVYEQPRTQLLEILKSASGLGAIVTRLKAVLAEKEQKAGPEADSRLQFLVDYLQVLCAVLKDKSTLSDLYNTISSSGSIATQRAVWNEVTALLAGGRLIGVAAEAYNVVKVLTAVTEIDFWVSDGKEYSRWIGSNIAFWASEPSRKGDNPDQWKAIAEVVRKGLRLGYPGLSC